MKKQCQVFILFFAAVICSALASVEFAIADHPRGGLDNGEVAPDFSLPDTDNRIVTLSDRRGKENVVLVFYRGQW